MKVLLITEKEVSCDDGWKIYFHHHNELLLRFNKSSREETDVSRLLLIWINKIREIFMIGTNSKKRLLKQAFMSKALFYFESIYLQNKFFLYNPAMNNLRYILDTISFFKGLNSKTETECEALYKEFETQKRTKQDNEFEDYVSKFSKIRTENRDEWIKNLFNHLSNKNVHPHSLLGALIDGEYNKEQISEINRLSILFLYGLFRYYIETTEDCFEEDEIKKINEIFKEIENEFGLDNLQVFCQNL